MNKEIALLSLLILIVFSGCHAPETPPLENKSVSLSELKGHFLIEDLNNYGVWYVEIEKRPLQTLLMQSTHYTFVLNNSSYPIETHKIKSDCVFVLLPEQVQQNEIDKAIISIGAATARNSREEQRRSLQHLIIEKDVVEHNTNLFKLTLSDYIQLKADRTSFIYKAGKLIRPSYVISDEGNAYSIKRYYDARQVTGHGDVDDAFRFLNALNNPDTYMFFENPNQVTLKADGSIQKEAPDNRERLREMGSCGDLNAGNFYNIETDAQNNNYHVSINLTNIPPHYSGKSFFSAFLRGASECIFTETNPTQILQTTISFDSLNSTQVIKNARFSGFMYMLTDDAGGVKGHYSTLLEAAEAAHDTNKIIVGTGEVVSEKRQATIHHKSISILSEDDDHFTLDYTNNATRSILLTGGASLTLKNAIIRNCDIAEDGGAMLVTDDSNVEIRHSVFSSNKAVNGGAIKNEKGVLFIANSTLTSNWATENGGGLYNGDICTIQDSTILLNQATGNTSQGNALYNAGELSFYGNAIDSNTSTTAKEALRIANPGTVYNSTLKEWKRFNTPTAGIKFVENRSTAENTYINQGSSEGCNIKYDPAQTTSGTLTLQPLQGKEEDMVSLSISFLTGCELLKGSVSIAAPLGFEITDDASVIIQDISYPASIYAVQPQLITISTLTLDEGSTVSLILKNQQIPAAYASVRTITKAYEFTATSDADGLGTAFSFSGESTAVFSATGLSRNTDFQVEPGKEMFFKLETTGATSLKIVSGVTPAEIRSQLKSVDGNTQNYTIYDTTGVISDDTPITSAATLTVEPPKGNGYEKDFEIKINPNPYIRLELRDNGITWHESIQNAINNGTDDATLTLWEGIYNESVDLGDHNFHIVSTDPSSETVRDNTIITGLSGPAITINGGQNNRTTIRGLCIKGNTTGCGIKIGDAHPIISNNWITQNQSQKGAGITLETVLPSSPRTTDVTRVENNLIQSNSATYGGGIYVGNGRNPKIVGNEIKENTANTNGGGIYVAEGATVQNISGEKWKAHQLPGTTNDVQAIEGVDNTNSYTLNTIAGNANADDSQLYYTRTDTSHLTDWLSHNKLDQIIIMGSFSLGDIMRVFDSQTALTEIASETYTADDKIIINREVNASSAYYFTLQDSLTTVYAQSSKKNAPVINTPYTAPQPATPTNNAVDIRRPATLEWTSCTGAETYNLYLGTNQGALTLIGNFPKATLQYTHNFLVANTTYYWKMEAVDKHGATLSSDVSNFKTFVFEAGDGTSSNPYQLKTAAQLDAVRNYATSHFIQTGNINLSGNNNWSPINAFSGAYDGGNHTISNLKVITSAHKVGLFGNTSHAILRNIHLTGVYIDQDGTSYMDCGALVGNASSTTITNCHSSGRVDSDGDSVGGLVGHYCTDGYPTTAGVYMTRSHSDCAVSGRYRVGGLVGNTTNNVHIEESYAMGNVTALGTVGGLIGLAESGEHIEDCYARGWVKATYYNSGAPVKVNGEIGGLIGKINSASHLIKNCYSTGEVIYTSPGSIGGFVGRYDGDDFSGITDCFWDMDTSKRVESACGVGKTTAEMQTQPTFTNWDFNNTWIIDGYNEGYPRLQNNQ